VLIPHSLLSGLADRLRAESEHTLRIASIAVEVDPFDLVRSGAGAFHRAGIVSSPNGRSVGGLGVAARFTAAGSDRFAALDEALQGLPDDVVTLVGFSFTPEGPAHEDWDGFPAAEVILPQITVIRSAGKSRLILAVPPGVHADRVVTAVASLRIPGPPRRPEAPTLSIDSVPQAAEWAEQVAEGIHAIEAGSMQKVVLARSLRMRFGAAQAPFDLVALLRDRYPGCRAYGVQSNGGVFVGASPELLVARSGRRFTTRPLAGSARRGDDPAEDRAIGDRMLASDKDRSEHSLVVDDIAVRLRSFAETLDVPVEPLLERFATVQHLATPITGTGDVRMLRLIEALHPTPAVGGTPRSEATAFIAKIEGIDRGWYSGGIGWADPRGDGEVSVALRCALTRGDEAVLFAGNGIVAGSDPVAEVEETRLKFRPLLDLLTDS